MGTVISAAHVSVAQASPSVALRYSTQRKLRDQPPPMRHPRPTFSPAGVSSSHASSHFWLSDALLTHHPSPQHTHTHRDTPDPNLSFALTFGLYGPLFQFPNLDLNTPVD